MAPNPVELFSSYQLPSDSRNTETSDFPSPSKSQIALFCSPAAETEKFASEISKKILPIASILIRAVEVTPTGIVTARDPLFGTLAAKTLGNVFPPSVEYE